MPHLMFCSRANRDVESNADRMMLNPSSESSHRLAWAASVMLGKSTTGPRVMASWVMTVVTPPPELSALQPREVEATSVPSVVAMGIGTASPSMVRGPAMPTGRGMNPTTFSQQAPMILL